VILKFFRVLLAYTNKIYKGSGLGLGIVEEQLSITNGSETIGKTNKSSENLVTLFQSRLKGSLTFWFAIKKSTTGPGWTIMVVDTSKQIE